MGLWLSTKSYRRHSLKRVPFNALYHQRSIQMRSFLNRSFGGGTPSPNPQHPLNAPYAPPPLDTSDPESCVAAFNWHWAKLRAVIVDCGMPTVVTAEHVENVFVQADGIAYLLCLEVNSQPVADIGPILDSFFTEDIFSELVTWCLQVPVALVPLCQVKLLRMYEGLVVQSQTGQHCLLVHKPILLPLLRLLDWCDRCTAEASCDTPVFGAAPVHRDPDLDVRRHFVLLLNQICTKMAEDVTLLEFFFDSNDRQQVRGDTSQMTFPNSDDELSDGGAQPTGAPKFLVFTLLVRFLYARGELGQLARDAVLLILSVSRSLPMVGSFIAHHSDFCPVLATGLSAVFSQLPRRLTPILSATDDWHRITKEDVESVNELREFYAALLFCNAVTQMLQVGHRRVLRELVTYVNDGFLQCVVDPALRESGLDELVAATAYMELCVRTVTEPCLVRALVAFLLEQSDAGDAAVQNKPRLIDLLVDRLAADGDTKLCQVTLALFHTLLELNCEDLMVELVFKYLLPCTHLMSSQIELIPTVDSSCAQMAERLLALTPERALDAPDFDSSTPNEVEIAAASAAEAGSGRPNAAPRYGSSVFDYCLRAKETIAQVSCDVDSASDGEHPSGGGGVSFSRTQSIRRSFGAGVGAPVQLYSARRHTSALSGATALSGMWTELAPIDLSILGPEFLAPLSDTECDRLDYVDRLLQPSSSDEDLNLSDARTPKYAKGEKMGGDYFKLAYDDEIVSGEESNGVKHAPCAQRPSLTETSDGGSGYASSRNNQQFQLTGWAELEDLDTFIDVLDSVRATRSTAGHTLEDHEKFLQEKFIEHVGQEAESTADVQASTSSTDRCAGVHSPMGDMSRGVQLDALPLQLGLPVDCGRSATEPYLGPFLTALFSKFDTFVENTLPTNLQLTGVFTRLACYPQPLLTSYLFHSKIVLAPQVRSLWHALATQSKRVQDILSALSDSDFRLLASRAANFLASRQRRQANRDSWGARRRVKEPDVVKEKETGATPRADSSGDINTLSMVEAHALLEGQQLHRNVDASPARGQHGIQMLDTAINRLLECGTSPDEAQCEQVCVNLLCCRNEHISPAEIGPVYDVYLTAARQNVSPDDFESVLRDKLQNEHHQNLAIVKCYRKYFSTLRDMLATVKTQPRNIVDLKWTLTHRTESGSKAALHDAVFTVTLTLQSCGKSDLEKLTFECDVNQIQALLWKMRELNRAFEVLSTGS